MQIKDYFTFHFKKPELDDDNLQKENWKKTLDNSFEYASSRLESIQILSSNTKTEDSYILLNHLLVDLYNIPATYYGLSEVQSSSQVRELIQNFPESGILSIFQAKNRFLSISNITKPTEEDVDQLEEEASEVLIALEKHFKSIRRNQLHSILDDYKKRWTIQVFVLISILTLTIGPFLYKKSMYPAMKDGESQVYFLSKESPTANEAISTKLPILVYHKGEWKEYRFAVPGGEKELIGVRIDPINQSNVRFGLSHIRLLNNKGKVVFERDFQLSEKLIPSNHEQIGAINGLKAGRAVAGGYAEMISIGSDPYFHLNLPIALSVATAEVRMRVIEEFNHFKD